jgi:hypothetical protein
MDAYRTVAHFRRVAALCITLGTMVGCASSAVRSSSSSSEPSQTESQTTGSSTRAAPEATASQEAGGGSEGDQRETAGGARPESAGETREADSETADQGQAQAAAQGPEAETDPDRLGEGDTGPAAAPAGDEEDMPGGSESAQTSAHTEAGGTAAPQSAEGGDPTTAPAGAAGSMHGDEALQRLESELAGSLESFDEALLEDRNALQARVEAGPGRTGRDSGGGQSERSGSGDWGPLDEGALSEDPLGTGQQGEGEGDGEGEDAIQSTGADGGSARTHRSDGRTTKPGDIPSGDDDDIVARQLREAAERETDPALREKLWAEYRAYKLNQSKEQTGAGS